MAHTDPFVWNRLHLDKVDCMALPVDIDWSFDLNLRSLRPEPLILECTVHALSSAELLRWPESSQGLWSQNSSLMMSVCSSLMLAFTRCFRSISLWVLENSDFLLMDTAGALASPLDLGLES